MNKKNLCPLPLVFCIEPVSDEQIVNIDLNPNPNPHRDPYGDQYCNQIIGCAG